MLGWEAAPCTVRLVRLGGSDEVSAMPPTEVRKSLREERRLMSRIVGMSADETSKH